MSSDNNLPTSWKECTLGEVVEYGRTTKAEPNEIPTDAWVLELEDIERDTSRVTQRATFAERQSKSTKNRFSKGDVLYGKLRPYLNKVIRADEDGYCTTEIVPLIASEILDSNYLFYWLKHPKFQEYVASVSHGLSMPRLGTQAGKQAPFVLAPLPEQKRIADKLDAVLARVDACRERLDRVPGILKRFRQAVLAAATSGELTEGWRGENPSRVDANSLILEIHGAHELAGGHKAGNAAPPTEDVHDLTTDMFPDEWGLLTLRDLVAPNRPITYGILKPGPELEIGVPYIRVADFPSEKLNSNTIRRTSPAMDLEFKRSRLKGGDLLLSIRGTVGRIIVIPPELADANITQDSARLSIQTAVNRDFVLWYLRSQLAQSRMKGATKGVAVRGINIGDVRALQVPLPSRAEQDEIVRRVHELFAYADHLESRYTAARAHIDRLTPSLLAKAFRGELVRQDPNDEPASQLLERISATRSAPGATKSPKKQRRANATAPTPPNSPKSEPTDVSEAQLSIFVPEQNPTNGGAIPEENLLAALRTSVRGERSGLTESELLRGAASRLGFERLGKNIRTVLEHTLPTALHRRVVVLEDDRYVAATPTIARYDDDFLMESLSAIMRSDYEYKPDDIAEMMAGYLGYSAVTEAMRERIDGVVAEGLRVGVLTGKGGWVWRVG